MTGDGINDAPALKQAEVGIAVHSASDVAKASAQVVLTRPGLQDMIEVVSAGRRVCRRMLTWTITKIARTVELVALLTIAYIVTGFFVTPLFLIVVIVVLNDVVTITLATDRAWISPVPAQWNVREIGKLAGMIAAGWLVLAFALLWLAMKVLALSVAQAQTLMFAYLIYSAQATIYLTRVRGRCWSFAPSRYVAIATLGNAIIASLLAATGVFVVAVPPIILLVTFLAVLATALVIDQLKVRLFRRDVEREIAARPPTRRAQVSTAPSSP
jgi:H+-transporting ATPase